MNNQMNVIPFNMNTQAKFPKNNLRAIAITGGKGGVGKTNVAVNVSLALTALGRSVMLLDADMALANADMLLGLSPEYHIGHFLSGEKELNEIIVSTPTGLKLIPGSSGIERLANLSRPQHYKIFSKLQALEQELDFLIIDTPAGISNNVVNMLSAASEIVIVTEPEPTAMLDAYATIKLINRYMPAKPTWVVVNKANGLGRAEEAFNQLNTVVKRFLNHSLEFLGSIPLDLQLGEAVRQQCPIIEYAPDVPASRSLRLIAKHLNSSNKSTLHPVFFWQSLSESFVQ